jgi:hypothetical protein
MDKSYKRMLSINLSALSKIVAASLIHQLMRSNIMSMRTILVPNPKIYIIALISILGFTFKGNARTYYSRTNGGSWSVSSTWSTVTYGNATNAGTYPQRGDIVLIGNGYTIIMDTNAVCSRLTIGQGVSGELQISPLLAWTMTIAGTLTVNNGGRFIYSGNSSRTHSLFVNGNIVNNGTIDLYSDINDVMNITFNSRINSIISGNGTFDLNRVTLLKSSLTSYTLDVQTNAFETGIKQLVITYGTYIHNNTGTYRVNLTGGNFTLPVDGVVRVPQGIMHLTPRNQFLFLEGTIDVTGGTLRVGSTAGTGGIAYRRNGVVPPRMYVSAGTLEVYGAIANRSGSSTDPFIVQISGGNVICQSGTTATNRSSFQINDVVGSSFTMSNGTITIQRPNLSAGALSDFNVCGSVGTMAVTAGTVEFGNMSTSTGANFNFTPYPGVILPNFKITGNPTRIARLYPSAGSTSNFILLSLYIDVNKTFDINSISGASGSTRTMQLYDNYDGINAFYNAGTFNARSSTVLMQAIEGQWLSGTSLTTFYNLSINNPFGISLGAPQKVSNLLSLTDGIVFTTSTNLLTITSTGSSTIGSSLSYVDGPIANEVSSLTTQTLNIPVGKLGAYRPILLAVRHTNLTTVTYTSEAFNLSARSLGYSLPSSIGWVSDVRHYIIDRSPVANLMNARITLSYGADDFVNDYINLRVAQDNGASAWVDQGGVGSANVSGSITSANFTSFNRRFTLANSSGGSNPLPVEFVGFNAVAKNNNAKLTWATASEKNADYFEVQKSFDGNEFIPVGYVKATGNSTTIKNYFFDEPLSNHNITYYRIRQVDFNGDFIYSNIKSLKNSILKSLDIFPNPTSASNFNLEVPSDRSGDVKLSIIDYSGKLILQKKIDKVVEKLSGDQLNLSQGIYLVSMVDDIGNVWQNKLVIQ